MPSICSAVDFEIILNDHISSEKKTFVMADKTEFEIPHKMSISGNAVTCRFSKTKNEEFYEGYILCRCKGNKFGAAISDICSKKLGGSVSHLRLFDGDSHNYTLTLSCI